MAYDQSLIDLLRFSWYFEQPCTSIALSGTPPKTFWGSVSVRIQIKTLNWYWCSLPSLALPSTSVLMDLLNRLLEDQSRMKCVSMEGKPPLREISSHVKVKLIRSQSLCLSTICFSSLQETKLTSGARFRQQNCPNMVDESTTDAGSPPGMEYHQFPSHLGELKPTSRPCTAVWRRADLDPKQRDNNSQ